MTTSENRKWPENLLAELYPSLDPEKFKPGAGHLILSMLHDNSNLLGNVIYNLYCNDNTEKETALICNIGEDTVHELKKQAFKYLSEPICIDLLTKGVVEWANDHTALVMATHKKELEQLVDAASDRFNTRMRAEISCLGYAVIDKNGNVQLMPENGDDVFTKYLNRKAAVHIPIHDLNMTARTYNVLHRTGVSTLGDITEFTEKRLRNLRNAGRKTVEEIKTILENHDLQLQPDDEDDD